jgi:anti-anti-sigma factor
MRHTLREDDGIDILVLEGPVTGASADGAALYETMEARLNHRRTRFVMDCGEITRIDAFGLGVLLGALARARDAGGAMHWADVPGPLRSLLLITDFASAVPAFDTVADACAAHRGANAPGEPGSESASADEPGTPSDE